MKVDIGNVIYRMFEVKDDEPCLCMSGKPFRDCHKLYELSEGENRKKIFAELLRIRKRKECLFGNGLDCSGRIVRAHSVSKQHLRNVVDSRNHAYSFIKLAQDQKAMSAIATYGIMPDPALIGVNDITTFPGLCEKHDNELFSSFEKRPFAFEDRQIAALHLRPVLKEIHTKTEAIKAHAEAQKFIGKVAKGLDALERNAFSVITALGNNLSLRDLYVELGLIREYVLGISSERLIHIGFEAVGKCPFLCSSTVNPAYDVNGRLIQDYNDDENFTRSFSFNIIAESHRYIFLFSWFDCDEMTDFFESLFEKMGMRVLQWLVQMVFAFSENSAISTEWYDSLGPLKRQRLKKIFFAEVLNMDSGRSTFGEFRDLSFASGEIKNIITNSARFDGTISGR